jgi:DNA-binding CsgD family transcriptional regulator
LSRQGEAGRREVLTERQAEVLGFIVKYHRLTGAGCAASIVAERLKIHHESARQHLMALHRKGWLMTSTSPAIPRRAYLSSR